MLRALKRLSCLVASCVALGLGSAVESRAGGVIELAGEWRLRLEHDVAREAGPPRLSATDGAVRLPGSLQEQGFGDPVRVGSPWTPRPPTDSEFHTSDRYAEFRREGEVKVPFALQPNRMYVGAACYERTFAIPEAWSEERVVLWLERPHWFTEVWVDGVSIGRGESLSTPHWFVLPDDLAAGEHKLQVRVDNRLHIAVGQSAHSVSDHTQTNWNGVVGRIELRATPRVWVDHVRVDGDLRAKRFVVQTRIGNTSVASTVGELVVTATPRGSGNAVSAAAEVRIAAGGAKAATVLELGPDASAWEEFDPALYDLRVMLRSPSGEHEKRLVAGLREVGVRGTQITINGRPTFLRGTLECCVFPETGYPPTDVGPWRELFTRCQEFGLNHVRFHSYCPPEAAFVAADELGVYLQPEAASWAHVGDGEPIDQWIVDETQRILDEYGNHPSFVMMAYGNEPHPSKPTRDAFLAKWVTRFRSVDPRRLYCCASGWPTLRQSDYHVLPRPRLHQWGEGMRSRLNAQAPSTTPDFRSFVAKHDRPVVAHEIGQWCVFPDFSERKKYQGVTRAKNLDIFERFLEEAGLDDLADEFHMASGALQALCYKEEVETSLRTPGLGGFQLLGLNDFPGQGTAPVGLCDAFWDVKRYASPERFRRSCDAVVALARLPRRVYSAGDTLEAGFEVANYSRADLLAAEWRWRLRGADTVYGEGTLAVETAPTGGITPVGSIRVALDGVVRSTELTLSIEGPEGVANDWAVWVYSRDSPSEPATEVRIVRAFDAEARSALSRGETVVLLADPESVLSDVQVGFSPIFWNTAYTSNQPPHTLGLLVDPTHRAFELFPTSTHSDWQWWEVLDGCRAMELDRMPSDLRPLVRVIPDWFKPQRLALAFEANVESGRLLACSAELAERLDERHAARAFRTALIDYASSDGFDPSVSVSSDQVAALFQPLD